MLATPARIASFMAAGEWACAPTGVSSMVAVSTIAFSSSKEYAWSYTESPCESTPPEAVTLMTSAPYLTWKRTARRSSSTPSAIIA